MARTIEGLLGEARTLLSDSVAAPVFRYSTAELMAAFNGAVVETRAKRPDLFLDLGLRNALPLYTVTVNGSDVPTSTTAFPLDLTVYTAFLYYIVGRSELREDTFANDKRAETLMNKFVSQILTVAS